MLLIHRRDPMDNHTCMADQCTQSIPRQQAFCRRHWWGLSAELKDQLNRAYREWQFGHEGTLEALRLVQNLCIEHLKAGATGRKRLT